MRDEAAPGGSCVAALGGGADWMGAPGSGRRWADGTITMHTLHVATLAHLGLLGPRALSSELCRTKPRGRGAIGDRILVTRGGRRQTARNPSECHGQYSTTQALITATQSALYSALTSGWRRASYMYRSVYLSVCALRVVLQKYDSFFTHSATQSITHHAPAVRLSPPT